MQMQCNKDTFTQTLLHYTWCQRSVHYFGLVDWSKSLQDTVVCSKM